LASKTSVYSELYSVRPILMLTSMVAGLASATFQYSERRLEVHRDRLAARHKWQDMG